MERIRVVLSKRVAKTRLVLNSFIKSMRLHIHHVDYATDRLSAFLSMKAKGVAITIEKSFVYAKLRFPTFIHHVDYATDKLLAKLKMEAKGKTTDYTHTRVKAFLMQQATGSHVDYDASRMSAKAVYPIKLGELAEMTLGAMSYASLGDLTFTKI